MKKRGQFSLLVVIGILVLIVVGLVVYNYAGKGKDLRDKLSDVEEKSPLKAYVEQCVEAVAKEAVVKLGEHGGYINPRDFNLSQEFFTDIPTMPTMSDGVSFFGSDTFIPYWYYMKSSNTCVNCVFSSMRPDLVEVEEQINKYVNSNLNDCLLDFETFEDIQNVDPIGKPRTITTISEGEVNLEVDYPLEITSSQVVERLDKFETELDLDLLNVYRVGTDMLNTFTDAYYLDKITELIIVAYSLGEDPRIPPMYGGTELGRKPYMVSSLGAENFLKEVLQDNYGLISVSGAGDNEFPLTESNLRNFLNRQFIPTINNQILDLNVIDLRIDFLYFDIWPIFLDISGGGDGLMIVSEMQPLVGLGPIKLPIFLKNMNFVYDIAHPVVIEITDPYAFNGEGYSFKFAMEVNIRNNQFNFSRTFDEVEGGSIFTYLCDPSNRHSANVRVSVSNEQGNPLPDAAVMFTCGDETCYIADTDSAGIVDQSFPVCIGGEVYAQREEYYGIAEPLSPTMETEQDRVLALQKASPVKVIVKKRPARKSVNLNGEISWIQQSAEEDLLIDEKATIILARTTDPSFTTAFTYDGSLAPVNVNLVPGTFNIEGVLIREFGSDKELPEWKIPTKTYCAANECFTLEEILFEDAIILGGIQDYEFSVDDVGTELTIYVSSVNLNDIKEHSDLTGMSSYTELIDQNPSLFTPAFS